MLAYELYLKNKDSNARVSKKLKPIKKIYYDNGKVTMDEKTIEGYGSDTSDKFRVVQEWLSMPLNTSDASALNLPDARTSNAQPNPYFEIYGNLKTNKSKESVLTLSIGKNPDILEYSLDLKTNTISKKTSHDVNLKIDTQNYLIANNNLYDEYVRIGLIDKNGKVNKKMFEEIVTKFFEFSKKRPLENPMPGTSSFSVYVLPTNSHIQLKQKESNNNESAKKDTKTFTDSFGNTSSEFASSSTKTAKFLSFDDKAFTLNCAQKSDFYKNIGIGNTSLDKVYFPQDQTFDIAGLKWVFTDISNCYYRFKDIRRGIFSQLYHNYRLITKDNPHAREKAILKVICYKETQAKQEILIDENLTMDKMKRLFSNVDESHIPNVAFEVLIETEGKSKLWNNYLYAIKNFLTESKIPKDYLLALISKIIRKNIHGWLKENNYFTAKDFFTRSDFCIKFLLTVAKSHSMNSNEDFAFRVGQIARQYIDFKQKIGEESNSLKDIVTYSKYDREKLRFVIQRVGIGINLAKANESDISNITEKVTSLQPREEITDNDAQKDFSYFFYKGYFSKEVLA